MSLNFKWPTKKREFHVTSKANQSQKCTPPTEKGCTFFTWACPQLRTKHKKKESPQVASKQGGVHQKLNINIWP